MSRLGTCDVDSDMGNYFSSNRGECPYVFHPNGTSSLGKGTENIAATCPDRRSTNMREWPHGVSYGRFILFFIRT